MKRKGGFYNYILVLPCVLLSCLTVVLFWLPPESPAKMVLGMNIFTSFFVLLLLLSKNVPSATDKIPLIGAYYCLNMVMIATSTCSCTAVVHIYFRGQGQVPYLIRKIFLEFLARIFCMVTMPVLPPGASSQKKTANNNINNQKRGKPGETVAASQPQPATIITSVNTNNGGSQQPNGNVLHHTVNSRTPVLATNRLSQLQMNSASCTALNAVAANDEQAQLLINSGQAVPQHPMNYANMSNGLLQQQYATPAPVYNASYSVDGCQFGNNSAFNTYQQQNYFPLQQPQQQQQSNIPTHAHPATNSQLNNELSLSFNLIENDIKEIRDYLRHTRKKLENTDAKTKQTNEWKQVALVLDRTLFYLYIIAIIVSMALMFAR
jgi:hypothetical protein